MKLARQIGFWVTYLRETFVSETRVLNGLNVAGRGGRIDARSGKKEDGKALEGLHCVEFVIQDTGIGLCCNGSVDVVICLMDCEITEKTLSFIDLSSTDHDPS